MYISQMKIKKLNNNQGPIEMVNLIPMINLIFLLLIFFLLTGVVSKKDSENIERPESEFGVDINKINEDVIFTINNKDEIYFQNNVIKINEINDFLVSKKNKYILDVDKEASIHLFNKIMLEMKKRNIKKVFVKVSEKKNGKF